MPTSCLGALPTLPLAGHEGQVKAAVVAVAVVVVLDRRRTRRRLLFQPHVLGGVQQMREKVCMPLGIFRRHVRMEKDQYVHTVVQVVLVHSAAVAAVVAVAARWQCRNRIDTVTNLYRKGRRSFRTSTSRCAELTTGSRSRSLGQSLQLLQQKGRILVLAYQLHSSIQPRGYEADRRGFSGGCCSSSSRTAP